MNLDDLLMGTLNQRMRSRPTTRRTASTRPGQRPGQAAVDFGRSFTGGAGPGAEAVDRLSRDVFSRLASKGLYKDASGTWQKSGLERPDVTRQIRDSAVTAMGGQPWMDLVKDSDSKIFGSQAGLPSSGRPGSLQSLASGPQPGLSAGTPSTSTQQSVFPNLGSTIASQVQSSIGSPGTGSSLASGIQAKAPSAQSIQGVIEAHLKGIGQTPPVSGPLSPPTGSGPAVPQSQGDWVPGRSGLPPMSVTPGTGPRSLTQAEVTAQTPGTLPNLATGIQPGISYPGNGQQSPAGYNAGSMGVAAPGAGPAPSTTGSFGGGWPGEQMDTLNAAYDSQSSQTGVPGNVVKAIQTLETGGNVIGYNGQVGGPDGDVALNSGIKAGTAAAYGLDFNRIVNDPEYAAYAVGVVLNGIANTPASSWPGGQGKSGSVYDNGGWEAVANIYFAGEWGGGDVTGRPSSEYVANFDNYLNQLGGAGPMGSPGQAAPASPAGSPSITNPDGTLSESTLTALGSNSNPQAAPTQPGALNQSTLNSLGAGRSYDPSGGIPGHVDPATGKFIPDDPGSVPPVQAGEVRGGPGSEHPAQPPVASGQIGIVYPSSGGIAAAPGTDTSFIASQSGGVDAPESSTYKGPVAGAWYDYQVGHGASADEHAALDIAYPTGTQISGTGLMQGTVECSSCGSYCTGGVAADGSLYCDGVGVGEIRVSLDPSLQGGNQITMLYGHMLTSNVQAGQQVTEGTPIGTTGYAGTGPHMHQESRAYCPGMGYDQDYRLIDPTLVADGYYQSHNACTDAAF